MAALDTRLAAWQGDVAEKIKQELSQPAAGRAPNDPIASELQQKAVEAAITRAGDGPRRELNAAMDELCGLYLRSEAGERAAIRALVQENSCITHDLWGYIRRAAEQVRSGGGEQWLRLGLAVVAIEDSLTDLEDTRSGLADLYLAAEQSKINARAAFEQAAMLANPERHPGRELSTRELLEQFRPPLERNPHGQR